MKVFRKPAVAGFFYPADPYKLKEELNLLMSTYIPKQQPSNVIGLVAPHAGYAYSGRTAAYGYNVVKGKEYDTVVIISPSHREYFPGVSVYSGDGYETPLGVVPVNKKIAGMLVEGSKNIFEGLEGHKEEHAIEVQIPFLQTVLKDFSIVPLVMGDQGRTFIEELVEKLTQTADEKTLIVASSDLSHYYSTKKADQLDSIVEKRINDFDYNRLQYDLEERYCEACGGGAIVAAMKTALRLNKNKSVVLHRSDSGYITGDHNEVVGYLSAVFYGE